MTPVELVRLAVSRLRRSRVRAALTMLGVIIGVASVIAMVAVGNGASAQVQSTILSLGSNLITVTPAQATDQTLRGAGATSQNLTEADMRGILAALVDEGLNGQFRDYAGAEQATMAIGSVTNFMYQKGFLKSARDINGGLASLQAAVANDERYSPGQFETALRNFRGSVGQ